MTYKKLIIFFLFVTLLASCSTKKDTSHYDDPGKPAYGDTMVTASIGEASSLIPILASDSASHEIAGYTITALSNLIKISILLVILLNRGIFQKTT